LLPDHEPSDDYRHTIEIESSFGLQRRFRTEFFPASSLQGPFLPKGLAFLIRLVNSACEAYANPTINRRLEPPLEVKLRLPDGNEKSYWCNWRLWALYRGFSVGPYVLQCALMALESFLLELCKNEKVQVEDWLTHTLWEANNVALVAVVASVASAYPVRAGKVAVSVLTSKDLVDLDRSRSVAELQGQFKIPLPSATQRLSEGERRQANALPHRKEHLETLALRLQFTPAAKDVHALLDSYRAALPAAEEQTTEDKLWRLALNRMDLRKFRPQTEAPKELEERGQSVTDEQRESRIYFVPEPLEADLQAVVDDEAPEQKRFNEITSLSLWAHKAFDSEPDAGRHWEEKLGAARVLSADNAPPPDRWSIDTPVFVAAVCVRGHWAELPKDDREWCVAQLISTVKRDADTTDLEIQLSGSSFEGAAPAASTLPVVLNSDADEPTKARVLEAIALALTHSWTTPCTAAELDAVRLDEWSGIQAYKALMPLFLNTPDQPLRCGVLAPVGGIRGQVP
jgi:hypothetical protein